MADSNADIGKAYLYHVCVANPAGNCTSGYSRAMLGARYNFPTDPTVVGYSEDPAHATSIQAAHMTELRHAVNAVRTLAELAQLNWDTFGGTKLAPASGVLVYATHVQQLRQALNEALAKLGIPRSAYNDETLAGAPNGTPIRASHIRQLRDRATSSCMRLLPVAVTASRDGGGEYAPGSAVDGNRDTKWGSGWWPTQWIQLDLGQQTTVTQIRLLVDQVPEEGHTIHNVYVGPTPDNLTKVQTFNGDTHFWQVLEVNLTSNNNNVRYVKIETTESVSWVSWAEIEVYGSGLESPSIHWMVNDQLGTPRMVFAESGSLANMSRHEYLPFGEDVPEGSGLRNVMRGYTNADVTRQKFTQKERDDETGLNFFEARYYSSTQGRFTGPDPANVGAKYWQIHLKRFLLPESISRKDCGETTGVRPSILRFSRRASFISSRAKVTILNT